MFNKFFIISVFITLALFVSTTAAAETAEEILKKADAAIMAKTSKMEVAQKVVTPAGDTRTFKMISYAADQDGKGLTEYLSPNQVRGMKILSLNDGDDIWTYFPRTNRTRKLASSARNRRVQGSDFTYDDMASGKMAKNWTGKLLGEEEIGSGTYYKLELVPTAKGPKSYSKAVAWINKADYTTARIEYWDEDGDKIKRLDIGDYKKISGVLVPHRYTMTNLTDGGKTMMKVLSVEINIELPANIFSESSLGN